MTSFLEVCAFGIQSCLTAEKVGAVRVELCDNPIEGGTTPSYATIKRVRERVAIQLYPIIRPRSMNYLYDEDEWQIIMEDIRMCKQLHCDGVSVGIQKINGEIDADKMKKLVEIAYPMQVTCNRAFDAVPDPYQALEILIDAGCKRVLTSGLAASAPEGTEMLKNLVIQANKRISIMPGAGIRSTNIAKLKAETGAFEFHASARIAASNPVLFLNPNVSDAGNMYVADEQELIKLLAALH